MSKRIDIKGQTFGRLTVVGYEGYSRWACRCVCGGSTVVASYDLRTGHIASCGCLHKERASHANSTHRYSRTPTYQSWAKMRDRCGNPKCRQWQWYGARGISVHSAWHVFENFLADMGERPSTDYTLDRIDPNGNYEPGNCRWALPSEGVTRKHIVFEGRTVREWADVLGVTGSAITYRLRKHGTVHT